MVKDSLSALANEKLRKLSRSRSAARLEAAYLSASCVPLSVRKIYEADEKALLEWRGQIWRLLVDRRPNLRGWWVPVPCQGSDRPRARGPSRRNHFHSRACALSEKLTRLALGEARPRQGCKRDGQLE